MNEPDQIDMMNQRELRDELRKLIARAERYQEALEFYADPANWRSPSEGFALQYDREPSPVEKDRGRRARRLVNVRKGSNE